MSKQHRNKQKCVKLQQSPVYPSSYSELCKYTALNVLKHFEQSPNRKDNDDFPEVNVNADEDSKFLVVEDLAAANLKGDNSNNNSNNSGAKKNKKKSPPKKPKNTANKAPPSTRDCFGLEENSKSKLIAPVMPILKNSCNAPPGKRQSSIRDVAGCGTMDARAYARLKSCCGAGATATKNQQLPSALRGCCGPDFVTGLGHVEDDSNKRGKRPCRPKCTSSTLHAPTISSKAKQPEKHPRNVFAALLDELETMKENKTKRDGGGGGAACVKTKEPNPISYSSLLTSKAKPCGTKRPAKKNAGGTVSTQTPPVSPASTLNPSTASESKPPPKPVRKKKKTETPASPAVVTPQTKAVAVPKKDQKLAENPSGPCANSQFRITINELHCEISSDTENTVNTANPAMSSEKTCPSKEDCCSVVTDSFIQQLKSEILNTKSSHLTCESTYVEVKQQEKYVEKLKDEISVNKAHCLEESRNRLNQLKCEIAKYRMYGKTQGCLNCMYAPKEMGACSMCAIRNDPIQEEEPTEEVPESSALAAVPGTSGATCRIIDEEVVQTIWQPTGPLCPETTDESDENTTTAEEDQEFKRKLFEANKLIDKVKNTLKDLRMSVNVKKNIEGRKDECVECGETEMSCSFLEGQTAPKQTPRDDVAAGASKQADQRNRDSVRASVNLAQFLLTQPEDLAAAPKNLAKFIHAQLETLTQAAIASAHQQPVEKQDQGTIYARHCVSDLCLSQDLCCNVSNPVCCRDDYSEGGKRTAARGEGTAHANDGEMTSEEEMPMSVLNTIVEESEGDVASRTRTAAEAKESGRSMNKGAQERQENISSAGHSIREPPPLMDRSTSPIKTTTFDNTIEVHQDSSSHSEEQEVRNTYSTMVGQRPDKVSEYSDHIASTVHSRRSSVVAPISLDGDNENMTVQNIELLREKLERQRQKQLDDEREREKLLLDEQQTNGSLAEKSSIVTTCSQRCSERRRQSQIETEQQARQTNEGVPKRSSLAVCHQGGVDSCGSHSKPHEARGSFSVRLADEIAVQEIDPVAEESETLIAKTSFDNGNDLGPAKSPQMQIQKMPPVNIAPELTTQATLNLEIKPTDSGTNAVATDEAKNTNIGYFQVKRESVVEQPSNPEATTSLAEPKPKSGIKCGSCKKKAEIPLRRLTADPAEVMQKQVIRLEKQATPSTGSGTQPMKVQIELPVDLDQLNEDQEDDLVRLILKSYQCVKEGGSSHELDVLKDTSLGHLLSEVDLDVYRTYINPDYPAKSKKDEKKAEQEEKIQQVKELVKAYVQRTILPESIVDTLVIQSTDPHTIGFYETKSCQTSFDSMYTDQFYNSQFGVKSPPDGAASGSAYADTPERDVFSRRRGSGSSSRSTSSSDSRNNNIKIQCSLSNSEEETSSSASLVSTTISHFLGGLVEQPNAVKATPKQEDDDQSKKERSNEPSSSVDEETKPEQPEDQQAQEESKTPSMKDDGSSKKPPKNNVSIKRGSKSPNDSMDGQKLAEKWNKLIEKEPPVAVGAELTTTKEAFQSGSPDNLTVLRVSPESPPPRLKAGKDEILGRLSEYTSRVECLRPTTCRSLKRQHYRTEASTSDSVSVRESSARGESSRCPKSSLSGGEIRETCKDLHGRTYNIRYLKKHPEKMLQCELDDKTLKLSRQRKYYSHWIAYYVQKHKRVPDEEDKANVPSPSNSRKSPKGK